MKLPINSMNISKNFLTIKKIRKTQGTKKEKENKKPEIELNKNNNSVKS